MPHPMVIAIGEAMKKKSEPKPDEKEQMALSAMDSFISSVHKKDSQSALDCLHDLIDMCSSGEAYPEGESEAE